MSNTETFESWAIVELMGHRTRPGLVKEVEIAGGKMLRIDIPISETETVTEFYGTPAIYSIRPATEELVRDQAGYSYRDPRPIRPVDYRPQPAIAADDCED
ncbi:hypothetical protein J2857_003587 [Neorhizobium galegae]|uniref:hypothetical protein n=1 Tax=Neorhizobium galegae TaxID=399 RepID=UPI001AE9BDF7|nr:hypothetical protein [Neorhizobium galegae]MBP2560818.1 hypothetical protein [Neorhizobium galegae]